MGNVFDRFFREATGHARGGTSPGGMIGRYNSLHKEMNAMLNLIDNALSYLVTGLGVVFLALTPVYAGNFTSRGGVEYMGAVLFLVFLGLLNLARIKSGHHSARSLAICADVISLFYLLLAYVVERDPAALGVGVLVLLLCFTAWMNRKSPTTA